MFLFVRQREEKASKRMYYIHTCCCAYKYNYVKLEVKTLLPTYLLDPPLNACRNDIGIYPQCYKRPIIYYHIKQINIVNIMQYIIIQYSWKCSSRKLIINYLQLG